eukprot:8139326-Lingulodinium_polyedra.AAC.1
MIQRNIEVADYDRRHVAQASQPSDRFDHHLQVALRGSGPLALAVHLYNAQDSRRSKVRHE